MATAIWQSIDAKPKWEAYTKRFSGESAAQIAALFISGWG